MWDYKNILNHDIYIYTYIHTYISCKCTNMYICKYVHIIKNKNNKLELHKHKKYKNNNTYINKPVHITHIYIYQHIYMESPS